MTTPPPNDCIAPTCQALDGVIRAAQPLIG
jgi:hypothetical protein